LKSSSFDESVERDTGEGLSAFQAAENLVRDGRNVLTPGKVRPWWLRYLLSLVSGFGLILWLAVLLCVLAYWPLGHPPDPYNLVLAFVILAVVLVQVGAAGPQGRRVRRTLRIAGHGGLRPAAEGVAAHRRLLQHDAHLVPGAARRLLDHRAPKRPGGGRRGQVCGSVGRSVRVEA